VEKIKDTKYFFEMRIMGRIFSAEKAEESEMCDKADALFRRFALVVCRRKPIKYFKDWIGINSRKKFQS
jgi:hypothetical protein